MALTPEEVADLLEQAQQQADPAPITTPKVEATTIKEGTIIPAKEPEYKTPEQLREDALNLALEDEKAKHIIGLEARLIEDLSLTPEQRAEIEAELTLHRGEKEPENTQTETPEQEIARLKKELEDAKASKDTKDPLAEVEAKAKEKGIDVPELYKEYVTKGELSPESLKSLLDAGFDEVAINAYIETKTTQGEKYAETLISETVGTRDTYNKMAEWMRSNLTPSEISQYDAGVNTEHAKIYIENMYSKYNKATAQPVVIRSSGESNQPSKVGFKSMNEQALAIADARYGTDIKYTNEVRTKIQLSTF